MARFNRRKFSRLCQASCFIVATFLYILIRYSGQTQAQIVLFPRDPNTDPFKDNPKWERFKSEQHERILELKVLVDNVWNPLDVRSEILNVYPISRLKLNPHFSILNFQEIPN